MAQQFYDIEVLADHPEAPRDDVAKRLRLYALDPNEDGSYYSFWIQDGDNNYPLLLSGPAEPSNSKSTAPFSGGTPEGEYVPMVNADGYGASSLPSNPPRTIRTGTNPAAIILPQGDTIEEQLLVYVSAVTTETDETSASVSRAALEFGYPNGLEHLVSTATIDLDTNGSTQIFSVGPGLTFIPTKFIIRAASATPTTSTMSFGFNIGVDDVVGADTYEELTSNAVFTPVYPMTGAAIGSGGSQLSVKVANQEASTTNVTIDVFGYYV